MAQFVTLTLSLAAKTTEAVVKIAKADKAQAAVASLASVFFANVALHSTRQFFDWPFEGSCSFVEIPKYLALAVCSGGISALTARIAYLKMQVLYEGFTTTS